MSGGHGTPGTARTLVRIGRGIAVATTLLVVAGLVPFLVLGRTDQLWEEWIVHNVLSGLLLAVVLWFIVGAEPRNPVVWIVGLATGMSGLQVLIGGVVVWQLEIGGVVGSPRGLPSSELDPLVAVLSWVNAWTWLLIAVPLATFLPLLFPEGHLPSPRWRPVAWLSGGALVLAVLSVMAAAWPTSMVPLADAPVARVGIAVAARIGYPLLLVSVLASLVAPVVRSRRAGGVQRRQLRWVGLGAAVFALLTALSLVLDPSAELFKVTALPGVVILLGSIAVAILRYRLYEIDRIVSRTVTYGLVTAVLAVLYMVVAVVPAALFDLESDLLVAGATLVAAAAFGPVRRRVQAVVDRRFNRSRYDAGRTAERFAGRLRDEVDLDELAGDLRRVVATTMQPTQVSLWLRDQRGV